jgi:hypothetical protein
MPVSGEDRTVITTWGISSSGVMMFIMRISSLSHTGLEANTYMHQPVQGNYLKEKFKNDHRCGRQRYCKI